VRMHMRARDLPTRASTGAYILHAGLEKLHGDERRAAFVHGAAASAYPALESMDPVRFLRLLAVGEIATGTVLLLPTVPAWMAGTALTGFSGALLTMYWRTPTMHKESSIWPTAAGMAVSKDVWMLGIGLGLVLGGGRRRPRDGGRGKAKGRHGG